MSSSLVLAVQIDPDFGFGSRVVDGIREEARQRRQWRILPISPSQDALLAPLLDRGQVAGVIGSFLSDRWVGDIPAGRGIPVVNVGDVSDIRAVPSVVTDNCAVGRLAARHLLETGAPALGIVSDPASHASKLRAEGFAHAVAEAGAAPPAVPPRGTGYSPDDDWGEWAAAQPHPLAVFCTDDFLARRFLRRVLRAGLRVPEDVAVLGVGDSPIDTVLAQVPLSSVRLPAERIGAEAFRRIEAARRGGGTDAPPLRELQPDGIAVRESTALRLGAGPLVARALAYLSENIEAAPSVAALAKACRASRRTLENAFRRDLGRSPGEEFRRMRILRATQLLQETDLPLTEVAASCGYAEAPWFWTAFKRETGQTPQECRLRTRRLS